MDCNRCDICVEETCKGSHDCNCRSCKKIKECYRMLHPTIRITDRCTQECEHCCFRCSPKGTKMMSIEMAKSISNFLKNNQICSVNLMGGEFFLNKDWYEIILLITNGLENARIVTTGDWAKDEDTKRKLLLLKEKLGDILWIAISNDEWHTNRNVAEAETFLKENGFIYHVETKEEGHEDTIVPIGKADGVCSFYGMLGCYCHNPKNMYSFLINENGTIYKCGFGVWDYASVQEYETGGFRKRFKEFNKKFYEIFIPSCAACIRSASRNNALDLQDN